MCYSMPPCWMDPSIARSQTILWSIMPSIDSLGSQCHLCIRTCGLWYHLNLPLFPMPKGLSYNMPLAKRILLGIIPSIGFQLIISRQSISWEGYNVKIPEHGISILCLYCLILNSCWSTQSPNMIHLENFSLLSTMYKGKLVVLQALLMYSYRGMLWNSHLYFSCCLVRYLSHSSTLDNLVINSTLTPMSSSIFLFSCKTMSKTV